MKNFCIFVFLWKSRKLSGSVKIQLTMAWFILLPFFCTGQVQTGSNGGDGALNLTTNTVINMADHPTGIYQYTSINIPTNVAVTFIPNAMNTPVYWLVQGNVVIGGTVDVSAQNVNSAQAGLAGPGGWNGGSGGSIPSAGNGPGGGSSPNGYNFGGNGSYGSQGAVFPAGLNGYTQAPAGVTYGNSFLIPLQGGSGGGGWGSDGGGGGGGAILIAASAIELDGQLRSEGAFSNGGGAGSGGAVRLYAALVKGSGIIDVKGATFSAFYLIYAGQGRVRIDALQNDFSGSISGVFTSGFQPIVIPAAGQLPELTVTSVGGVPIAPSPTGSFSTPDAVLSAQQNDPIPIIVNCANLPLHSLITISVKPANAAPVSATGYNDAGTLATSTATILVNIPRGGGLIYATATTGN